jgi:bifunctional non-homologous end joining protein LigD
MATTPIQIRGGRIRNYCLVNDLPSLLWMANQGAIELHVFLWRVTSSEQPTELVLDLDPGIGTTWRDVSSAALLGREELERIGLTSWAKASGATGIHVHAPVDGATFTETKSTAREVARRLSAREPSLIIDRMRRSERTRRVFIDWGQNDPRRSMIAVYSLRAMPEPTSALPLRWRDLERAAT